MSDVIYLKTGQFSNRSFNASKKELKKAADALNILDDHGAMSNTTYTCDGISRPIFSEATIVDAAAVATLVNHLYDKLEAYSSLLQSGSDALHDADSSFKGEYTNAWQRGWYSISSGVSTAFENSFGFWGSLFHQGGKKTGVITDVDDKTVNNETSGDDVGNQDDPQDDAEERQFDNSNVQTADYSTDWGEDQRGSVRYVYQLGDYSENGWVVYDPEGNPHYDYCGGDSQQAGTECGYAAQSMALSYLGIDKSPGELCEGEYGKVRGERPWYTGTNFASSYDVDSVYCVDGSDGYYGRAPEGAEMVSKMVDAFLLDNNGELSPVVLHYHGSGKVHTITVIGKTSSGDYIALDPAKGNQKVVFSISENGTVSGDITYPGSEIDAVQQFGLKK